MGKAARRKRKRRRTAPPPPVPPPGLQLPAVQGPVPPSDPPSAEPDVRRRRSLPALAAAAAVLLALGLAAWLLHRGAAPPGPEGQTAGAASSAALPDPDTSVMTPPVARAIREARQAALGRPDSAAAVGRFGQVLHAHWLLDDAAACYEIAHALAPGEFRWVYLLAGVEDIRGADGERIDRLFRRAIRLAPGFPAARVRHADALLRLGRWSEARDAYRTAVDLDPDLVLAQRGLGQAATLLGDGAEAVEHLERAAALAPGDRIVHVALARAYTLAGRGEEAAEAARKAQEMRAEASLPDPIFFEVQNLAVDPETLRRRISRSLRRGDFEAALGALAPLEESEGPGVRRQLAAAAKRRANQLAFGGDLDAALPEFERASRLAPTDPEIEHNWGTVLLRRGDLEAAGRRFERAIALDPQSADSLYNLGVVLEGLGRPEEAVARFRAAAAIDPRHPAARRLAELGVASGR